MSEKEMRQIFKNNSDCYADTLKQTGCKVKGEVIQAMTENRFIEVLNYFILITPKSELQEKQNLK